MIKRFDNTALFLFMCLGIYSTYLLYSGEYAVPVITLILIPFLVMKRFRPCLLMILTGSALFVIKNYGYISSYGHSASLDGENIVAYGTVLSSTDFGSVSRLTFRTDSIYYDGSIRKADFRFVSFARVIDLERGDGIEISGRLQKPSAPTNYGEYDARRYFLQYNINADLRSARLISVERKPGIYRLMNNLQNKVTDIFDRRLRFRTANFLSAVMLGRRERIEREVIDEFSGSGAIHLLAVSGLHVGFLAIIAAFFCSLLNIRGWFFIATNTIILTGYAVFTGGSPSVIRAVLMAVITMLSFPMNRKIRFIDIIGTAGILSLIWNPNQIFGPGFILSFGAAVSIAVIYQPLTELASMIIPARLSGFYMSRIVNSIVISLAVTIGLMPFVLYMFGRYNLLSVFSNVFLIPLTAFIYTGGAILLALNPIEIASAFIADMTEILYWSIQFIVSLTNRVEVFTLYYRPDILTAGALAGAVAAVFYLRDHKTKTFTALFLCCILAYGAISVPERPYIYEFHTESNDTVIIESCGTVILIAGALTTGEIRNIIRPHLLQKNIRTVDFLVYMGGRGDIEKTVRALGVPVSQLASYDDFIHISGLIDLNYTNGELIFNGGRVRIGRDGESFLTVGGKTYIHVPDRQKRAGKRIKPV